MGNKISNTNEPSLLLQLYGKKNIFENNTRLMVGGKSIPTDKHIDFEEDFEENFVAASHENSFVYKYSQLSDRIPYHKAKTENIDKKSVSIHLGQIKLFFTELLFLTKYINGVSKVLYVGAAMGYHISKLAELFPKVIFDLWDPGKFMLEPRNNIKIYNLPFKNENARMYASDQEKILFMCDIRTLTIAKFTKEKDEEKIGELVENDMIMQAEWIKIINPVYAYLKFRLPWLTPKSHYLGGTIYLQPYSPVGTEARLMTNNYTDNIEYDNFEYDEKMAYFDFKVRTKNEYPRWKNIFLKYNLLNCWDNAFALYITDYYLRKIHNISSDDKTGELYMDILNFHIKQFGNKYKPLFNEDS